VVAPKDKDIESLVEMLTDLNSLGACPRMHLAQTLRYFQKNNTPVSEARNSEISLI